MVTQLQTMSGIGGADESDICIFGKEVCRWAQTKLNNDQGATVSCDMRRPLCYGADSVSNLRVSSTWDGHS